MIIIVKFQVYAWLVIVLAVSRKLCISCRWHVDVHKGRGVKNVFDDRFSCGRHNWMTPIVKYVKFSLSYSLLSFNYLEPL